MPSTAPPPRRPRVESIKSTSSVPLQWGVRPPSPTMSATTMATDPGSSHPPSMIVTRKDLRQSLASFEELMHAAKSYRQAVLALSSATAALGGALEACSRVKGCNGASDGMMGASGLEQMMGSHGALMGDTFYRQFEIPLLETLDNYRASVADRQAQYEQACHEKTALIRKTEQENLRQSKRKRRDLQQFRHALAALQAQVNDLDRLKGEYHQEVLEAEDEMWNVVLGRVAFFVRAQMEIYEKVTAKSTDPALEPLMSTHPDPFDAYGPPKQDGQIFSVLAPLGLMNGAMPMSAGPSPSLSRGSPAPASPPAEEDRPAEQGEVAGDEEPQAEHSGLFGASTTGQAGSDESTTLAHAMQDGGEDGDFLRRRRERELSVIEDRSETGSVAPAAAGKAEDGSGHEAVPGETRSEAGVHDQADPDPGNDSEQTETPDQASGDEEAPQAVEAQSAGA